MAVFDPQVTQILKLLKSFELVPVFNTEDAFAGIADNIPAVFLMSGQSNWDGLSSAGTYTGSAPSNVEWWNGSDFVPLVPGVGGFRPYHNPTIHFANAFRAAYPTRKLIIIENGQGGAGFANGQFSPGGPVRAAFFNTVTTAFAALSNLTTGYALWAFVFNQGEADSDTLANANAYGPALTQFIADLKAITKPTLKVILTRINDSITGYNHIGIVRAAQETLGDGYVDIDAVPMTTSGEFPLVHYGAVGYQGIGEAQFARLQSVSADFIPYVAPPAGPTIVDFTAGLSALPSGWTKSAAATAAFSASGLTVGRTVNAWGQNFVASPSQLQTSTTLEFIGNTSNIAVGWSKSDGAGWGDFSGQDSLMWVSGGDVFNGADTVGNLGPMTNGTRYRLDMTKSGSSTIMQVNVWNGSAFVAQGSTLTLATPSSVAAGCSVFLDAAYSNLVVRRVTYVL